MTWKIPHAKFSSKGPPLRKVSNDVGYEILNVSNDKIIPVSEMDYEDNQKLVIFDDYVCEKKTETANWLFHSR